MVDLNVSNTQNPYLVADFMGGVNRCKSIYCVIFKNSSRKNASFCDWNFLFNKVFSPVLNQ